MTHVDFVVSAREVVENYWRIRAALRLLAPRHKDTASGLQFAGIPQVGSMSGLLQNETIAEAHASLREYATTRLSRDMFIALIAVFERRLITRLGASGIDTHGTLGALQSKTQTTASVPADLREDLDEVRERRNAQMHYDGHAHDKYVDAASKVHARAPQHVAAVSIATLVIPDGNYLTYAADVLVRYSAAI
jgi:hypothetical protein